MKYVRFAIATVTAAEDIIVAELAEQGFTGALIEDHVPLTEDELARMYVDIPPEQGPDDGTAVVSVYVETPCDIEGTKQRIRTALSDIATYTNIGAGTITVSETEDADWANNWKKDFHQFSIDQVLVVPSWEEPDTAAGYGSVIRIDPGMAFGTGTHETTRMCVKKLLRLIRKGDRVLDIGTGSGILDIVSVQCGAAYTVGTDIDRTALDVAHDNLKLNHCPHKSYELVYGDITDTEGHAYDRVRDLAHTGGAGGYDIIVSNILAEVLVKLCPVVYDLMRPGASFITSGIIEGKEGIVSDAMRSAGMNVTGITPDGDWRCVVGVKPR